MHDVLEWAAGEVNTAVWSSPDLLAELDARWAGFAGSAAAQLLLRSIEFSDRLTRRAATVIVCALSAGSRVRDEVARILAMANMVESVADL
jgi:hypothetical protein